MERDELLDALHAEISLMEDEALGHLVESIKGRREASINQEAEILPNWSMLRTAADAEQDFVGFKFLGPGWYVTKTGTFLVVPRGIVGANMWRQRGWSSNQTFCFYFYGANPVAAFNAVATAPLRVNQL